MSNNFSYLTGKSEFKTFARACVEAEDSLRTSPTTCVRNCRAALEKIMRRLYEIDGAFTIDDELNEKTTQDGKPFGELYKMMSSAAFTNAIGRDLSKKIHRIRKLGNDAMHGSSDGREIGRRDATECLSNLFELVQWTDRRYSRNYEPRRFDPSLLPTSDGSSRRGSALGNLAIILILGAALAIAAMSIMGIPIPWSKILSLISG